MAAYVILVVLAVLVGGVLRVVTKNRPVAVLAQVVLFIGLILLDAYVLPYRGGGASMWPIAVLLGSPVVFLGAALGAFLGPRVMQPRDADDNSAL